MTEQSVSPVTVIHMGLCPVCKRPGIQTRASSEGIQYGWRENQVSVLFYCRTVEGESQEKQCQVISFFQSEVLERMKP